MKTILLNTQKFKLTIADDYAKSQYKGKQRLFYIEHCACAGNHYYGIKIPYLYFELSKFI